MEHMNLSDYEQEFQSDDEPLEYKCKDCHKTFESSVPLDRDQRICTACVMNLI